jgi:predicted nucleic acid-binding protein
MAAKIVVDTSVLVKWVKTKDEDLLNEARHLLADIDRLGLEVHVPSRCQIVCKKV